MSKIIGVRMGANLGFIEKILLVDGTILENMHVLYNSPIPSEEQCELILKPANKVSRQVLGPATKEWSAYPEMMVNNRMFQEVE